MGVLGFMCHGGDVRVSTTQDYVPPPIPLHPTPIGPDID